ncbi:MAG: diguanylate cyclase [Comamonadaceae bacterium]|nr:MAG: diguanylate cyclase [Comamonadaceae bacterium]
MRPSVNFKNAAISLHARLILLGLVMAALGTAASYVQLTRFLRADLTRSVASQQTALAAYVAGDLDRYLGERLGFLERLSARLPAELLERPDALRAWLDERDALNPMFATGLFVADASGRRLDGSGSVAVEGPEFLEALAGRSGIGRASAMPGSGHAILPMATAWRDDAGRVAAVLVGKVDLSADGRIEHLRLGRVGRTGGILVISPRDRQFVAATLAELTLKPTPEPGKNPLHDRAMAGFRGSGTTVNAYGVEEIAAIASVPRSGWFVVARLPVEEALAPVGRMQTFILQQRAPAVILVLTLIGCLLAWLLRPLILAARQADRMTRGELPLAPLRVVRNDEIGHLTAAFNRLLAKLARQQVELDRLVHSDDLTGLPNRKLLDDRLQQALARAQRHGKEVAVLYLDLDGFKPLNDGFGHEAGDEALKQVAQRLLGVVRQTDTLARIGGDEFVLLAADFDQSARGVAEELARRCIEAVAHPLSLRGSTIVIGVSVGIALNRGEDRPEQVLAAADKAMYQAKQDGRGRYVMAPPRSTDG